jgi:hypothetical protein
MFKGCETAAVVEQDARAVCSRNAWDAGLITPYASVRGLGESLFMTSDESIMGMDETNTCYIFRTRWLKYQQKT